MGYRGETPVCRRRNWGGERGVRSGGEASAVEAESVVSEQPEGL